MKKISRIPVYVKCEREKYKQYKKQLKKFHLTWAGNGFSGSIPAHKLNRLQKYCKNNHLPFLINNNFGKRSNTYRKIFFKNNPPRYFFSHPFYFCSYCGLPIAANNITVDHLYPVGKAQKSIKFQQKMKEKGFVDINDVKNLVPACWNCNIKKGAKTGLWILKGKIGKNQFLWFFRNTLRLASFIFIVGCFVWHGKETVIFFEAILQQIIEILCNLL